jgi:Tol biopolymer transport system component
MNADGTQIRTLADMEGYASLDSPFWSHDGKKIAFDATTDNPQNNHVFVVDVSGGEPRDLGLGSEPSWSADDKQLCFFLLGANSAGEKAGIYVMNADGNARQYVTSGTHPRWSPDGGRIAYLTKPNGGTIRVWDLLDSKSRIVLNDKFGSLLSPPAWSPDSKEVAFLAKRERTAPILLCVVDAQGDAVDSTMLKEDVAELSPCWAPGEKILFAQSSDQSGQLHCLNRTQPEAATQLKTSVTSFRDPGWSPDGKQIVFQCDR